MSNIEIFLSDVLGQDGKPREQFRCSLGDGSVVTGFVDEDIIKENQAAYAAFKAQGEPKVEVKAEAKKGKAKKGKAKKDEK